MRKMETSAETSMFSIAVIQISIQTLIYEAQSPDHICIYRSHMTKHLKPNYQDLTLINDCV